MNAIYKNPNCNLADSLINSWLHCGSKVTRTSTSFTPVIKLNFSFISAGILCAAGQKGEVITANGTPAKTTGGVFTSMLEAGSPNALANSATLVDAFEDMVLSSEYGDYGQARMAFMTPRVHRALSLAYKEELTRYAPNDDIALLNLKEVNLGSSRIVLVPFKRFEDAASFPGAFSSRIVLLDMKNIKRTQLWGERSGDTLKLEDGVPKRYGDIWVDCNMGVKFHNPLACAWLDINY